MDETIVDYPRKGPYYASDFDKVNKAGLEFAESIRDKALGNEDAPAEAIKKAREYLGLHAGVCGSRVINLARDNLQARLSESPQISRNELARLLRNLVETSARGYTMHVLLDGSSLGKLEEDA